MNQERSAQDREDTNTLHAFCLMHLTQTTYEGIIQNQGILLLMWQQTTASCAVIPFLQSTKPAPSWFIERDGFTSKGIWETHISSAWLQPQQSLSHQNTHFGNLEVQGELRAKHCLLLRDSYHPKSLLFSPEMKTHFTYFKALFSP